MCASEVPTGLSLDRPALLVDVVLAPEELWTCVPQLHVLWVRVLPQDGWQPLLGARACLWLVGALRLAPALPLLSLEDLLHDGVLLRVRQERLIRYRVYFASCDLLCLFITDFSMAS